MLIDTDVLIWYLRGNEKAFKLIGSLEGFYLSVISYIELVQGMRNKNELTQFRKAIRNWNCRIIHINEEISTKAMFYIERHYLSHSLHLADALIATTAIVNGLTIITGNEKHYKIIKELEIRQFRPD